MRTGPHDVNQQGNAVRQSVAAGLLRSPARSGAMPPFKARPIRGNSISRTISEDRNAR